jgi:zinc protease
MCAAIIDPGYRDDGLWQFQKSIPVLMQQLKHTTAGPLRAMQSWLHGGNSRYSAATLEELASYTIADARNWLEPELNGGYLELSIVGDIDPQTALPDLLTTFGALPQRSAAPAALPEKRRIETPAPPSAVVFHYESTIPQAMALMLWKTVGQRGNAREFRRLQILASVLKERLREEIRENLGASYSPVAMADGSEALENLGFVLGQSVCNPEDIGKILNSMRSEAAALAADGASADELDRARRPILGMLGKSLRDNSYWLRSVLGRSQAEPERIELARDRDADYRSITLDEINALAAKYLTGGNAISITIRPQAP